MRRQRRDRQVSKGILRTISFFEEKLGELVRVIDEIRLGGMNRQCNITRTFFNK